MDIIKTLAKEFNISKELVNSAIAKVLRKLRHPEIAKPIHGLVTFIDQVVYTIQEIHPYPLTIFLGG